MFAGGGPVGGGLAGRGFFGARAPRARDPQAVPVAGPPTADPLVATTDLYFEIANSDGQLKPGQRLVVVLPSRSGTRTGLVVPAAALLYDIHGGTWVYVNERPHVYRRQRVELVETQAGSAFLSRGLQKG